MRRGRVVGGDEADFGEWPWQVRLNLNCGYLYEDENNRIIDINMILRRHLSFRSCYESTKKESSSTGGLLSTSVVEFCCLIAGW